MPQNTAQIIVKGEDKTADIRSWGKQGDKVVITYRSGKTYSYNASNVQIRRLALPATADKIQVKKTVLSKTTAQDCFAYLRRIAEAVGVHDPRIGNILLKRYDGIDVADMDSMFSAFLTGKLQHTEHESPFTAIHPFAFNLSQSKAINHALAHSLTIIEGPPGTGKTQTILNIIANVVMRNESVAVVSSNNSATANVFEKLEKYDVGFIAAQLGNTDNKQKFIESQKPFPNLSTWKLSLRQEDKIKRRLQPLYVSLNEMLATKNELSRVRQEFDALKLESEHFDRYYDYSETMVLRYLKPISSPNALALWLQCEKYIARGRMPHLIGRLINRIQYRVKDRAFYSETPSRMVAICQKRYYMMRLKELESEIQSFQTKLDRFGFSEKMDEYSSLSTKLFHNALAKKYAKYDCSKFGLGDVWKSVVALSAKMFRKANIPECVKNHRQQFELDDLWKNSQEFIAEYPVILATTYSLRSSLSRKVMYDYVIIDEASQVDLATGALALSCAKKAVIVGDLKQLPNVVDQDTAQRTDAIFETFNLPEVYRYQTHSLLAAVLEMFPNAPRTLLREHYRCHPKIIEFCNQKFYNNQLIVLTEPKSKRQPLIVYKTAPGNHARERVNQRQIDVIQKEILPQQNLDVGGVSVGIVTPYRNQTNALQQAFMGTGIRADTVDKFQGRENDVIILSTVDNEISEFTDNANRLNVAVSRAMEQLIVVMNGGDEMSDTNIGDLVRYVDYQNLDIIQSEIRSVFDYLYKGYQERRNELLRKQKRISMYDSESLMYGLIRDVLADEQLMKFDVAPHVPLKMLLRDTSRLDEDEKRYAENILTHVDFLIFDKLGKKPCLAIEVDGVSFHADGTRQAERDKLKNNILGKYNLPLIRFKTTGSDERNQLVFKLQNLGLKGSH